MDTGHRRTRAGRRFTTVTFENEENVSSLCSQAKLPAKVLGQMYNRLLFTSIPHVPRLEQYGMLLLHEFVRISQNLNRQR